MTIPHLRIIIPVAVVVVVAAGYIFLAKPFSNGNNDNVLGNTVATESPTPSLLFTDEALIRDYRTRAGDYLKEGKNKEALELLLKLEPLAPKDVAVHYAIARLYVAAGDKKNALAALNRGIPYLGSNAEAKAAYDSLLAQLK